MGEHHSNIFIKSLNIKWNRNNILNLGVFFILVFLFYCIYSGL